MVEFKPYGLYILQELILLMDHFYPEPVAVVCRHPGQKQPKVNDAGDVSLAPSLFSGRSFIQRLLYYFIYHQMSYVKLTRLLLPNSYHLQISPR